MLYVVATPIGHLGDISQRALAVLAEVDCIAAEDTRHSQRLLRHYHITTPMVSLHQHNEQQRMASLLARLQKGACVALISDAGTPLVSDPGYRLIAAAHEQGIAVSPVPGPCAAIAALSVGGLPADAFTFLGFAPVKSSQRVAYLQKWGNEPRTLIFYEAPHRIEGFLQDLWRVVGSEREVVLAKELTKSFETIKRAYLPDVLSWLQADSKRCQGEFVVLLAPAKSQAEDEVSAEAKRVLAILSEALPHSQAVQLTAKITGVRKNLLY